MSVTWVGCDVEFLTESNIFWLFSLAILAGLLDTLAGGGGLLTILVLMMTGMPPLAVLATNKIQASMGSTTSTILMLGSCLGSIVGAIFVQYVNTDILSFIIPVVLAVIAMYFLFTSVSLEPKKGSKVSDKNYRRWVVPIIGGYDGMFGPGAGSFFILAGVSFGGKSLITSSAMAKPLNFSSNIASLMVFVLAGQVVWGVGAVMMLGQVIGAWLGSHWLFKINPLYLRILIVVMCLLMLTKYLLT